MISHQHKFIFIHIPKTSGNSLSLFLKSLVNNNIILKTSKMGAKQGIRVICEKNDKCIKHENIDYYYKLYGNKINNYFKFTIVRNPYDRMLSYYFFRKSKNINSNYTFDKKEFIEFIKNERYCQYKYIDNTFHIVYYEDLINGLKQLDYFKYKVNFDNYPVLNKSYNSKINYNDLYDKELKKLVYDKFKKDFELFGYKK